MIKSLLVIIDRTEDTTTSLFSSSVYVSNPRGHEEYGSDTNDLKDFDSIH